MRVTYSRELSDLAAKLAEMCSRDELAIQLATQALLEGDIHLAEQVIADAAVIDIIGEESEKRAFAFLALQAPVAGDLRTVVSGIRISAELHRMGGLAMHVALIVRRRHPESVLPEPSRGAFADIGKIAVAIAAATRELLVTRDLDIIERIRVLEDQMNDHHRRLFDMTMDPSWSHGVPAAVDVTLLGRFYERFADQAVDASRRIEFLITGSMPEEGSLRDRDGFSD
ncbi:MAG: phosphate signaling complex protein PhoU [Rhodococcus sp. (in: high G+C Gram-positive bacteria)]|uniref:phosphate signaling complex protein PhoU n=1 Tax=Rhodococcus sp. TaxID=1831 RepID=UPI002ADBC4AD|nr:phosphate signaling complex protein PhoU [Rhodococcus sp. (in: high G+C Gram-positive bacteria)]MDZ7930623.1 phosphate signaling complex protein PhoU [Rhodococcus sp. (in: high G+C Gram-positive bacteria)]